jgi:hypothetical protein
MIVSFFKSYFRLVEVNRVFHKINMKEGKQMINDFS